LSANMVEFLTHGMDVHHAHIWVVPIYGDEAFIKTNERKEFVKEDMEKTEEDIKKALEQDFNKA